MLKVIEKKESYNPFSKLFKPSPSKDRLFVTSKDVLDYFIEEYNTSFIEPESYSLYVNQTDTRGVDITDVSTPNVSPPQENKHKVWSQKSKRFVSYTRKKYNNHRGTD
jgi:hypothetical protein